MFGTDDVNADGEILGYRLCLRVAIIIYGLGQ